MQQTPDPDEILAQLDAELEDIEEPEEVVNVYDLPNPHLLMLYQNVRRELNEREQMLNPNPATAGEEVRNLHSLRDACVVELKRRNLL